MGEWLLAGSGEEAIDITFLNVVPGVVELALDRVEFTRATRLCHEVDAGILLADSHLVQRWLYRSA